jgi:hypothetical protein
VNEDAGAWIVFCSEGPENGRRVRTHALSHDIVMGDEQGVTRFRWDGTYDDHGDARYRVVQ